LYVNIEKYVDEEAQNILDKSISEAKEEIQTIFDDALDSIKELMNNAQEIITVKLERGLNIAKNNILSDVPTDLIDYETAKIMFQEEFDFCLKDGKRFDEHDTIERIIFDCDLKGEDIQKLKSWVETQKENKNEC
jgi:hypothetical protein